MRELGHVEGHNLTLALRFAEGMPERMPALANELVGLKPDVIVAAPETSLFAVRSVTRTIPIITIWLQDPVASGAVGSIARPGGHVTGTWIAGDDALVGKRLELLKDAAPAIARVGVLVNPAEMQNSFIIGLLSAPARALGLTITVIQVRDAAGIDAAFAAAAREGVQALFVSQSPFFNTHRVDIAARAVRARLPAVYGFREFAVAGGLMAYGPSLPGIYGRFATLADKILKGARPADLPIEVPHAVRAHRQSQNCQGYRPCDPRVVPSARRRGDRMKRREFITLLGGTVAWPVAARAQQPALPVVGFVNAGSSDAPLAAAFRKGLNEAAYFEGQNVTVEYHWLEGQFDRLPALMADLVRRRVAVIATPAGNFVPRWPKRRQRRPIVFGVAEDPVKLGLVAGLARPSGNLTGINFFTSELTAKRLALLHELVPKAVRIAMLVNPANPATESAIRDIPEAARAMGLQIQVLNASTRSEIEAAFASLVRDRAEALYVAGDVFFTSRRVQFATLAASYRIPRAMPLARLSKPAG